MTEFKQRILLTAGGGSVLRPLALPRPLPSLSPTFLFREAKPLLAPRRDQTHVEGEGAVSALSLQSTRDLLQS